MTDFEDFVKKAQGIDTVLTDSEAMTVRKNAEILYQKVIKKASILVNKTAKEDFRKFADNKKIRKAVLEALTTITEADLSVTLLTYERYCDRCGNCCRHCSPIILSDEDVITFGHYLGSKFDDFVKREGEKFYLRRTEPCAFLNGNACGIYDIRPASCRCFPMTTENNQVGIHMAKFCSFWGNVYAYKTIAILIRWMMKRENPDLYKRVESWGKGFSKVMDEINLEEMPQEQRIQLFQAIMPQWWKFRFEEKAEGAKGSE
jgi:Fe-S-cluster containining protein